ncbi:MAG: class I SAM-dependent methyltransferase [Xanthomonadaceae bacterium]|nr:class I SAM-dependent methyltransferase [Xanthomonadaceae bacterium]
MLNVAEVTRLLREDQLDRARGLCQAELNRPSTMAPDANATSLFFLAACDQRLERPAAALASLQQAARLAGDQDMLARIADALIQLRAFDPAASVIERLDFSRPYTILLQARCRWGQGLHSSAVEQLDALSKIRPDWPLLALSHARMLINLDQAEGAGQVLDAALAHHPAHEGLIYQKTLLVLSHFDPARALETLERHAWRASERLCELQQALALAAGAGLAGDAGDSLRWEGFLHLHGLAGEPRWHGDNVSLLKRALSIAPSSGAIVECGVYHGRTVSLLADWAPDRKVYGFDSFEGLPEAWSSKEPAGSYSTAGRRPQVPANVELIAGWFADTLGDFANELKAPLALLHIDCDLYISTRDVLAALGPRLAAGSMVVFDEYTGYPGWRDHEHRAWREYCHQHGLKARLRGGQLLGQSAAFEVLSSDASRPPGGSAA